MSFGSGTWNRQVQDVKPSQLKGFLFFFSEHQPWRGCWGRRICMVYTTYNNGDLGDGSLSFYHVLPTFFCCTPKLKHMVGLDLIQTIMLGNVFPLSQGAQGDRYCNQWFSFPQFGAVEDPQTNTFTTAFLCKWCREHPGFSPIGSKPY